MTYDGLAFRPEVIDLMVIDLQPNMFIPAVPESQVYNYGLALSLTSMLHCKDNELLYLTNMLPSILLLDNVGHLYLGLQHTYHVDYLMLCLLIYL